MVPENNIQKQPPKGVLRKRYSENMQQSNFIEIALRHGCSPVNLLHVFRCTFSKEHLWMAASEYIMEEKSSSS